MLSRNTSGQVEIKDRKRPHLGLKIQAAGHRLLRKKKKKKQITENDLPQLKDQQLRITYKIIFKQHFVGFSIKQ